MTHYYGVVDLRFNTLTSALLTLISLTTLLIRLTLFCWWRGGRFLGTDTHAYQKQAGDRHGQKLLQKVAVHLYNSPVKVDSESLHSVLQLAITMGFFLKNSNHRFVKDSKSLSWQGQAGLLDIANRRYLSTGVAVRTLAAAVPSRLAKRSR
jgi:hypothetical protein